MRQFAVWEFLLFRVNSIRFTPVPYEADGRQWLAKFTAKEDTLQLMRIYAGYHLGGKN